MSASRNKKNSGLRILWIPGRKKHHSKGVIKSTNKNLSYPSRQKRSEPWSLGGSGAQKELLTSEIGNTEGPSVSGIIPVSCVVAGGLTKNAGEMKLEEEPNKFAILASYDEDGKPLTEPNECKQSEKSKSLSTLALTERRDHNLTNHQQDVNSIEHLDETKLNKNDFNNIDAADGGLNNFNYSSKKKHKKKKKKNKQNGSIDIEEKHDEDDKTVKCLYYTLMCCECTIS